MKKILSIVAITLIVFVADAQNMMKENDVIQVNSKEFKQLIDQKNGTLLDVRTPSEFTAEHIENSGQLNYYAFDFKKKLDLLSNDQPIYLYCNTGYRSQKAAEYLVKKGYSNVYNLEHGIMEWNLMEMPVIEGDKSLLDKENFMEPDDYYELLKSETPVLIDFYAPWCAPCRQMMPMIDSLKTEYHEKIKVVKVNVDISKKLVKELKLIGVPHFVFYKNGNLLFEKSGMIRKEEFINIFDHAIENMSGK